MFPCAQRSEVLYGKDSVSDSNSDNVYMSAVSWNIMQEHQGIPAKKDTWMYKLLF